MKKGLKISLIAIPVLLLIAAVIFYLSLGHAVKRAANRLLPTVTGTTCSVRDVDVSLFGGSVEVHGLLIGNPDGYHTENAFELKRVTAEFAPTSLFSDTIHIYEIVIEEPAITYEGTFAGASNINDIRAHVQKLMSAEKKTTKTETGRKVVIDRVVFKKSTVTLAGKRIKGLSATAPLPVIELEDIGKDGGMSVVDATGQVFNVLTGSVLNLAKSAAKLVGTGAKKAAETAGDVAEGAGDAAGKLADEAADVSEKARNVGEKALKGVKGLLGDDDDE